MLKIREDKWLEWCATFNAHISLSELWKKLRKATGNLPISPAHPQPIQEANRLAEHFAERSFGHNEPVTQLQIQGIALQWVNVYKYLAIWIDRCLKFDTEINYLRNRIGKRVNMMRAMTGPKTMRYRLLTHGSEGQWAKLQVAQNNAMRAIVKAPMWKKIENLHMETGLTSLQTRAERLTACVATKLITRTRESDIKNGLLQALNLNRDLLCAADAVNRLKLKDTILSKGPDTMSPDYSTPAPWESPPAVFNILQTGTRMADCNPRELRQIAERNMKALTPHNSTVYYTDGSVETTSTKAGTAFTIEGGNTSIWRTSDGCSTLQVELAAILGALRHASINSQQGVVIHIDSR
ncbi:hypothetical protein Hamer_G007092, partial [Homarus americanus]